VFESFVVSPAHKAINDPKGIYQLIDAQLDFGVEAFRQRSTPLGFR
jgi:hypothetical protein